MQPKFKPERYATHLDRLAAATVRLHQAGRTLRQSIDDVADSEALTDLGRHKMAARVYQLLGLSPESSSDPNSEEASDANAIGD